MLSNRVRVEHSTAVSVPRRSLEARTMIFCIFTPVARRRWLAGLVWTALILAGSCRSRPDRTVKVAVAANFAETVKEIAQQFQNATGYRTILSFGSTGQLYTQITQDAPFEVL